MKHFDSHRHAKWKGEGLRSRGKNLVLGGSSSAESKLLIPMSGSLKIIGKKKSGNGLVRVQLIDLNDVILFDKNISFTKTAWSEFSFSLKSDKNIFGKIRLTRPGKSLGRIEVGKIVLSSVEARSIPKREREDFSIIDQAFPAMPINIRIAIIVPYSIYGGGEIYIKNILENIDSKMFSIDILYLSRNGLSSSIGTTSARSIHSGSMKRLETTIANSEYDTIVFYNSARVYKMLVGLKKKKYINAKIVEIYHSDFKWSDSVSTFREREHVEYMFRVSNDLAEDISGIKKANKIHMPVGIDIDKFAIKDGKDFRSKNNIPSGMPIIGTVCRMSPEKDVPYTLELAKKMKDFFFILIGTGPEEGKYKEIASGLNNVRFLGYKPDIQKYYCLFDAFLLTSKIEGTPISILEAMASGLVVFAPDVGAISSIIEDEETGFLISKNIEKDIEIIKENYDNRDIGFSAREYAVNNHNIRDISSKFLSYLIPDVDFYSHQDGDITILSGEYI